VKKIHKQLSTTSSVISKFHNIAVSHNGKNIPVPASWNRSPPTSNNQLLLITHPIAPVNFIKLHQQLYQLSCWRTDRQRLRHRWWSVDVESHAQSYATSGLEMSCTTLLVQVSCCYHPQCYSHSTLTAQPCHH